MRRLLPLLLTSTALLGQAPATPAPKSEVEVRAESLLDRARQLSDIRARGTPAFQLKATFSFTGKNLEPAHGTYTETWISESQFRREIVIDDFHRVEVGTPTRLFTLDSTEAPEIAARIPGVMIMFPARPFEFESIEESAAQQHKGECAVTTPGDRGEKHALCFDTKSGALLQKIDPEVRAKNAVSFACFYGKFQKFGTAMFPRQMSCFEDQHRSLEAEVVELSAVSAPDPSLFVPPPGAQEVGRCPVAGGHPTQIFSPTPSYPASEEVEVALSLIVNVKGLPQDIKVVQSGGKKADEAAVAAVQNWRFTPASCNGEPMPAPIQVTIHYGNQSMFNMPATPRRH